MTDDERESAGARAAAVATAVREELARSLAEEATAEAQRAASAALAGAGGDALGAVTGGVSRLVLAAGRAALGPSADEKMEAAAGVADREAAIRVPHLETEVKALAIDVAQVQTAVAMLVRERADGTRGAFVEELAGALMEGGVSVDAAARSKYFGEAVMANLRRAFEVADPCVLPTLARLTVTYTDRPLDRFFRALGRLLVDLSRAEFQRLVALRRALGVLASSTEENEFTVTSDLTEVGGVELLVARSASFAREQSVCPRDADSDAVLRALIEHRLADPPVPIAPHGITEIIGPVPDRIAMSLDRRRVVFNRDVCVRLTEVLVAAAERA